MRTSSTSLIALLLVATLAASPAAAWSGPGGVEPDTPHDVAHQSMWVDATTVPEGRLYFSGFQALPQTTISPNAALLGDRLAPAPLARHHALLGVWTDCNGDGYIGIAETAAYEYRGELLDAHSPCRGSSLHFDGDWVVEFRAVGMVDPCEHEPAEVRAESCGGMPQFAPNEHVFYADGTAVWADFGLATEAPPAECPLQPLPRGTTSGTGLFLRYADCHTGRSAAGAVNTVDADGGLGLRFDDVENPQEGDSRLNHDFPVNLFGSSTRTGLLQAEAPPTFTTWDCSQPEGGAHVRVPGAPGSVAVADPTPGGILTGPRFPLVVVDALKNQAGLTFLPPTYFVDEDGDASTPGVIRVPVADDDGTVLKAPPVDPHASADPTDASLLAAAAHALDGPAGDCDPQTAGPLDPLAPGGRIEQGDAVVAAARKDRNSLVFTFYDGHRGFHPRLDPTTGETTPSDLGMNVRRHDRGGAGPMWTTGGETQQLPIVPSRGALGETGPRHVTYYARLGEAALVSFRLPIPGIPFTYGAEACAAGSADANGWVCDPDAWWKGADGTDARPAYARGEPLGAVPGDAYHMRDVDCLDGRLAAPLPGGCASPA